MFRHYFVRNPSTPAVIRGVSLEIDLYFKALHVAHALEAVTPGSVPLICGPV